MNEGIILLVEDNPSDVALTKRAFDKNNVGNELVVVEDGREALDFLFREGAWEGKGPLPRISVVLLDLHLPRIDGLTVLKEIRSHARTRRLPVVILTSSVEERDLETSYDLGGNSYIRKPVDFENFVAAVAKLGTYWLLLNEEPPQNKDE